MANRPNPPDRDDPATERAVPMDSGPGEPEAGAGRAINAAFSRLRPEDAPAPRTETTGQQDLRIEGPGYPSEDMDDVDPEDDGDDAEGEDPAEGEDEADFEDDDGYRVDTEESLETTRAALEEALTPPGGDDLGGDRDADPNLNGGHGIRMQAPEEGDIPIEEEDSEDSIIGHGHEAKAAWNRDRVAHLQEMEDDERDVRPGTSESLGLGGAVLAGALPGWEGGDASPTVAQGVDPEFDDELSEQEEVVGDLRLEDAQDILDDESIQDPDQSPFLPEHRDLPDDNVSLEEQIIAVEGEDVLSAGVELGVEEDLEMEDLNETDDIEQAFEDQRLVMDDAAEGNERRRRTSD